MLNLFSLSSLVNLLVLFLLGLISLLIELELDEEIDLSLSSSSVKFTLFIDSSDFLSTELDNSSKF